jgi:cation-transporting ATPase F
MATAVPTGTPGAADASRTHHDLPVHEVLLLLGTDTSTGLAPDEAARRLERFGRNELPSTAGVPWWLRLLRQMHNPLVYVLLASAVVTFLLGEYVDTAVIAGVVVVNTLVGYVQETKAEAALDALRSMVHTDARVVRAGRHLQVHSELLVPGDLVQVEAGDKVPADLRLVAETDLEVDESALTGESVPVAKDEVLLPEATPVADRRNMVYSGTLVTSGTGRGVVVATGGETELGEIHRLVGAATSLATPLTRKLARFSKLLTVVIIGLAGVAFAVGVARGEPAPSMFTAAVALAVGAIPEGLPAAVTVTLAIGVSRMARRRAVIRRLPAVETLGGATVVCTDKTGTLTENRMTVEQVWTPSGRWRVGSTEPVDPDAVRTDAALRWSFLAGAACNDARVAAEGLVGDPTETALLAVAHRYGVDPHALSRTATLPFTSERRFMATTHHDPETDSEVLLVKGAAERVVGLCTDQLGTDGARARLDADRVHEEVHRMAAAGLRVLATAVAFDAGPDELAALEDRPGGLTLTGLQGMHDPPRPTAAGSVRTCQEAGLAVKMITGDHAATARSIASEVGLLAGDGPGDGGPDSRVLTGADLDALDDEHLPDAAEHAAVFARVSPEQKLRLVEALQSRGHVVAMTGDGVNDAPALKQADIGVAMGRGGTEVAKEAGDMVLTDDDFATIEAAVEEGRGVFDNLIKFIVWTLPTNMGEAAVILVAVLAGAALPILPTQILWINMTTAVLLGLTLAWEPKEPGIMQRPPRDPRQSLLTRELAVRTLLLSALLVAGSWWVFSQETALGSSPEVSRTAALNVFVAVETVYLFSCRSLTRSAWRLGFLGNRWLLGGVALQWAAQAAITYLAVMNDLFGTAPLGLDSWTRVALVAAAAAVVVAVDKRRSRGRGF